MNDNNPLKIPDNWSGHQALAIFDFLDLLRQKVWLEYQQEITTLVRDEMDKPGLNENGGETFEFDDDINF